MPSFLKPDSALVTLAVAALLALGVGALATYLPKSGIIQVGATTALTEGGNSQKAGVLASSTVPAWAASAPGRVEPLSGEIKVRPEESAVVAGVYARLNEKVKEGDLLIALDTDDAVARIDAALAEVEVRVAERDEVPEDEEEKEANELLQPWRDALDALSDSERALHAARVKFDKLMMSNTEGDQVLAEELEAARKAIGDAQTEIEERRLAVAKALEDENLPPPTRLDSGLAIARSDLRLAENAYERTRVRAPIDGAVLLIEAKKGELLLSSASEPAAIVGDMSTLIVTAEVEERDIDEIRVGQHTIVRSNAFQAQDFPGRVSQISSRVGSPGLGVRGQNSLRDVEILEVQILLDGRPPLLSGMRVDVFFRTKASTIDSASEAKKIREHQKDKPPQNN
ncbi:MAG: HlyD family secretion protein [Hyphomicrobiaceae bacterium]